MFVFFRRAVVISVKNFSGIISIDADGSWVCNAGDRHKAERHPDPVSPLNLCFLQKVCITKIYVKSVCYVHFIVPMYTKFPFFCIDFDEFGIDYSFMLMYWPIRTIKLYISYQYRECLTYLADHFTCCWSLN